MDGQITRREMIYGSALVLSGACVCQVAGGADKPRSTNCHAPDLEPESLTIGQKSLTIDLAKAPSLEAVGNAAYIMDKDRKLDIIVVHAERDEYFALSRFCTHAYRPISYIRTRKLLMCNNASHSIFDLTGQVVKGPAPEPIKSYAAKLVAGTLQITL
ncbi:MAG: Rieske 2Fe-2S domain-containing protein [Planctomycetota bacterium]|nr:Rieske 2Fe-2S domain-containing protein [Planctomycetota bacterium]